MGALGSGVWEASGQLPGNKGEGRRRCGWAEGFAPVTHMLALEGCGFEAAGWLDLVFENSQGWGGGGVRAPVSH